jgi:hypothetical protein
MLTLYFKWKYKCENINKYKYKEININMSFCMWNRVLYFMFYCLNCTFVNCTQSICSKLL